MFGVEKKVTAAARKAALFSASAILACVGAAFLTVAAWLILSQIQSTLYAATIIGVVYFGLSMVGFAIASSKPRKSITSQPLTPDLNGLSPMQLMAVSFVQGIEQGARSKRKT